MDQKRFSPLKKTPQDDEYVVLSQWYTILTPKYCRKDQRSCDGWGGGQGVSYFIASVVQWKEKKPLTWEAQVSIDFIYFWRLNKKQQSCDGRGGVRSAPFGVAVSSKRRVRAAHGRTRAAKTH